MRLLLLQKKLVDRQEHLKSSHRGCGFAGRESFEESGVLCRRKGAAGRQGPPMCQPLFEALVEIMHPDWLGNIESVRYSSLYTLLSEIGVVLNHNSVISAPSSSSRRSALLHVVFLPS